jgi:hypothetical protein
MVIPLPDAQDITGAVNFVADLSRLSKHMLRTGEGIQSPSFPGKKLFVSSVGNDFLVEYKDKGTGRVTGSHKFNRHGKCISSSDTGRFNFRETAVEDVINIAASLPKEAKRELPSPQNFVGVVVTGVYTGENLSRVAFSSASGERPTRPVGATDGHFAGK